MSPHWKVFHLRGWEPCHQLHLETQTLCIIKNNPLIDNKVLQFNLFLWFKHENDRILWTVLSPDLNPDDDLSETVYKCVRQSSLF